MEVMLDKDNCVGLLRSEYLQKHCTAARQEEVNTDAVQGYRSPVSVLQSARAWPTLM